MQRVADCPWCSANLHSRPLVSERRSASWRGIPLYPVSRHFCPHCGGQLRWRFPGAVLAVVLLAAYVGLIWWLLGFGFLAKLAAIPGVAGLVIYLRATSFAERGTQPPTPLDDQVAPGTGAPRAHGL